MAGHIQARAAVTGRRGGRHMSRGGRCGRGQRPAPHRPASAPAPGSTPQHCAPATRRGAQALRLRADRLSQARPRENRARCPRLRAARNAQGTPSATCLKGLTQTESVARSGFWGDGPEQVPAGDWVSLCQRKLQGAPATALRGITSQGSRAPGGQAGSWTVPWEAGSSR